MSACVTNRRKCKHGRSERGCACEAMWENVLCVNVFDTNWEAALLVHNTTFPASDCITLNVNAVASTMIYVLILFLHLHVCVDFFFFSTNYVFP